jgi:purine-binding chemotaxis protein CheW
MAGMSVMPETGRRSGRAPAERPPGAILVFELEGRRYGLAADAVQELVRMVALTPLAGGPRFVEGVLNLRGQVILVIDLRARLGLPPKTVEPSDHLIVARTGGRAVAVRVDRALELVNLAPGDIDVAGATEAGEESVPWVAKLPDTLVPVYDLRSLVEGTEAATLWRHVANVPHYEEG